MRYWYPAYECGMEFVRRVRNRHGVMTFVYRVWCERKDCEWQETAVGMRKATFYMDLHHQGHTGSFSPVRLPESDNRVPYEREPTKRGRPRKSQEDTPPPF